MSKPDSVTLDIFKFQVYQATLNVDVDKIKKFAFSIKKKDKSGGRRLSNSGYQSHDLNLPDLPACMKKLKELIELHANEYGKNMHINRPLKLANMWVNMNGYKDYNTQHMHPYCLFSGAFYIEVREDTGGIRFWNPLQDLMDYALHNTVAKYEPRNSSSWTIIPTHSMLLLFPGYLTHSVEPNMNKKFKRISISFNLMT